MQIISKQSSTFKSKKGFTLIELLVVISIIGVLSSVVLAAVSTARQKGTRAAGQQFEHTVYSSLYNNILMDYDFTKNCSVSGAPISSTTDSGPNGINIISYLTDTPTCNSDSPVSSRMSANFITGQRFRNGAFIIKGTDSSRISESFWMKTSLSSLGGTPSANISALNGLGVALNNNKISFGYGSGVPTDLCYTDYPTDGAWHHIFVSVSTNASDANPGAVAYVDGKRAPLYGTCTIGTGWLSTWNISFTAGSIFIYIPEANSATTANPLLLNHLVIYNAVP